MRLKDSLYVIVSRECGKCVVRLNASSPLYAAHFPGYPITPGVILIQMATELLSEEGCVRGAVDDCAVGSSEGPLELAEAVNVKFVSPVIPGDDTRLTYLFVPDGTLRWKVNVLCSETLCAKMTLQYR